MADKTIKHFIFVRFFYWQSPIFPYDVLDVSFLSKQLPLTKNLLSSMENQTNKNFELVFMLHEKAFSDKKYEFIFSMLQNFTILPIKFIRRNEQSRLVKEALDEYDFVINTRMDFDDFLYKDSVADTQSKVNECDNIILYGYCKGYTYVFGELYEHNALFHGIGHWSSFQSFILESSFAKKLPFIGIYAQHHKFKPKLKDFLEKNGVEFSESMFQQNTSMKAYIYFRHEFSLDQFDKNSHNPVKKPNRKALTTTDITKKQLEDEFGFFYDLNSIK